MLARTRHRIRRSGPASGTSAAGFDGAARCRCRSVLRASRSRSVMACRNPALKASSNSAVSTSTRSTRRPRDAHEPAPGVPRGCGVAVGDDQDLRARDIGHRIASPWRSPGRSQARSASLSLTMSLREVISSIRAIAVSYAPPSPTPPRPAGPGHPGRLAGAESICLEARPRPSRTRQAAKIQRPTVPGRTEHSVIRSGEPTIFIAPTCGYPHEPSLLPACGRSGGHKSKLGVRQFEMVRPTLIEDSANELLGTPQGRAAA